MTELSANKPEAAIQRREWRTPRIEVLSAADAQLGPSIAPELTSVS